MRQAGSPSPQRWVGVVDDRTIAAARRRRPAAVAEWAWQTGVTYHFRRVDELLVIIRQDRDEWGGWVYPTRAAMLADWAEIDYMAKRMGGETDRGGRLL